MDLIIVTDWEEVQTDDFYLSKEWTENAGGNITKARELAKKDALYYGYEVEAVNYCTYQQMDSHQVLIDNDFNVIIHCESAVIGNKHEQKVKADEY